MLFPPLSLRHCVILGLMLVSLVALADGVARFELAQALQNSQDESARLYAVAGAME